MMIMTDKRLKALFALLVALPSFWHSSPALARYEIFMNRGYARADTVSEIYANENGVKCVKADGKVYRNVLKVDKVSPKPSGYTPGNVSSHNAEIAAMAYRPVGQSMNNYISDYSEENNSSQQEGEIGFLGFSVAVLLCTPFGWLFLLIFIGYIGYLWGELIDCLFSSKGNSVKENIYYSVISKL